MGINGHSASGIPNSDAHAPCELLSAAAAQRENCERPPRPATAPAETRAADFIKSLRRIFFLPPLVCSDNVDIPCIRAVGRGSMPGLVGAADADLPARPG